MTSHALKDNGTQGEWNDKRQAEITLLKKLLTIFIFGAHGSGIDCSGHHRRLNAGTIHFAASCLNVVLVYLPHHTKYNDLSSGSYAEW